MTYALIVLGTGALFILWDSQRRLFAHKDSQRAFERTTVLSLVAEIKPLIEGQQARDQRNDKALAAFLGEQRDLVKTLHTHAQKTSSDTVSKLTAMSRMGINRK